MKRVTLISVLLWVALVATGQPITRVRLITLQAPPDTTTQYFIQAGGGRDTIKYVPIDSLGVGGDGNGIISALPAGNVSINAASNDFIISSMDSLSLEAISGMQLKSSDIWLSQSGPSTTTFHASPFTNFNGTGYFNINMGFIGLNTPNDSIRISVDDFNDRVLINQEFRVDKYGITRFANIASSFTAGLDGTDEGAIVYNSTDNVPMFWDGSAWNNMADAASVPATPTEGYAVVETASADLQSITTTWEALEAQTSAGLSSGWSFSTGTDLLTYSGSTAKYLVSFSACFTQPTATQYTYTFTVRENGSDGNAKAVAVTSGADSDPSHCVSGFDVVTANSGDTFGLGFLHNGGSSVNATIQSSQLVMTKLVGQ